MIKGLVTFIRSKLSTKPKVYNYCRRCGKPLKTELSKHLGLGRCCYNKEVRTKYNKKLF